MKIDYSAYCFTTFIIFAQNQNQIVMASIRRIKNEIDYLVSEVISDGYMALYFNGEKRDAIVAVIEEAVAMRYKLYDQVNHPAD